MALRFFNTLTGEKVLFQPRDPARVGLYVCGPTVYDLAHVGHARVYVAFDVAVRVLRARGFGVTHVRNFTDVDDKILKRAAELGEEPRALSERFIAAFQQDMARLGVEPPDVAPKVTEHLPEILTLIARLLDRGLAYPSGGDVYFAVRQFAAYGKLSGRTLDDLQKSAGARVEADGRKRDPLDFALWKRAKARELAWDSPWGPGRPGWHIECSAMAEKYLGSNFEIHGGGKDLIFPHHENEIAQSEGASGQPMAHLWMHNGFVNLDHEKMSKSLGNFFTVREVLAKCSPEGLRFFLLGTHYRSPINFSDQGLIEAERRLDYFYEALSKAEGRSPGETGAAELPFRRELDAALDDDLNTPEALAALSPAFARLNELCDAKGGAGKVARAEAVPLAAALRRAGGLLGICQQPPAVYLADRHAHLARERGLDAAAIEALIAARGEARAAKDFARSDALRNQLLELGVEVKDTPHGMVWKPLV